MKKRFPAIVLMLTIFCTTALGISTYQKTITATYGINLMIDGKSPTLTDAGGNAVAPFVYEGTTYVPIRAVSENMGASVSYDSNTNTASVTSGSKGNVDSALAQGYLDIIMYLNLIVDTSDQLCDIYDTCFDVYFLADGTTPNTLTTYIANARTSIAGQKEIIETTQTLIDSLDSSHQTAKTEMSRYIQSLSSHIAQLETFCVYLDSINSNTYTADTLTNISNLIDAPTNLKVVVSVPASDKILTYYSLLSNQF